jgi:hypothetical protein
MPAGVSGATWRVALAALLAAGAALLWSTASGPIAAQGADPAAQARPARPIVNLLGEVGQAQQVRLR